MTPAELRAKLVAARALVDTPAKWIRGTYRTGYSPDHLCYCSTGAVGEACEILPPPGEPVVGVHASLTPVAMQVLKALYDQLPEVFRDSARLTATLDTPSYIYIQAIAMYNDDEATQHVDVMVLFDRAIAAAV